MRGRATCLSCAVRHLRTRDQMPERHLKRDVVWPVRLAQEHRRLAF